MKRVRVLVEGQTEETVVRDVLAPHLSTCGVIFEVTILRTKREKSGTTFKGGITSFRQVKRDLESLLGDTSAVAVTTMLDYYGLPSDFPGIQTRPRSDPYGRVAHVEMAFAKAIGRPRFIPHLTLHEIEAWIYVDPRSASWVFENQATPSRMEAIKRECGGAEQVNEGLNSAPSKRLLRLEAGYQKTLHGPMAIAEIGIERIRAECSHAHQWLKRLEGLG